MYSPFEYGHCKADNNERVYVRILQPGVGTASYPPPSVFSLMSMRAEVWTLEFWRAIIAECIATFVYVIIVLNVTRKAKTPRSQMKP